MTLKFQPLTIKNWDSLEQLFGEKGACGGCWCMLWRLTNKAFNKNKGNGNKKLLKAKVTSNNPVGILAIDKDKAIGWCSVSPKPSFIRLKTSRLFREQFENKKIWTISCLFIAKEYQMHGVSTLLIKEATKYAFKLGAELVEAYPLINSKQKIPPAFAWVGIESSYKKAGFLRVARPSGSRAILQINRSG